MLKIELNEKKIKILDVAEKLFAEKGYEGTSIRNISKEAKINVAMVSYYFGSKESLLESLVLHKIFDLKNQLEYLSKENLQPFEKVNKLIDIYMDRISANKGIFRIMHFEINATKKRERFKIFTEIKRSTLTSVEKIITEGQEKGIFKKEVITPLLTTTIIGTFFHFDMNKNFYKEVFDLNTDQDYDNYVKNNLTNHIKQTIKGLLIYEN